MAAITDIADAVVAELNGHTFSLPVTAVRAYVPQYELAEMNTLHVTVVPKGRTKSAVGRVPRTSEHTLDVAVQKKLAGEGTVDADPLMGLVEEIDTYFDIGKRLASYPNAVCVAVANLPIFAPDHFEQFRQFTSVLSLTFRVAG